MNEMENQGTPAQTTPPVWQPPRLPFFPTGKKELFFALSVLLASLMLVNAFWMGGLNLGFALASAACILCTVGYLLSKGHRPTGYSGWVLALCLVIALSFARSDDGFVKFVMLGFLLAGVNLGLSLLAGQNRRDPGRAASLLDSVETCFLFGIGKLPESYRGLGITLRKSGTLGKKCGAVLLGLLIAAPILVVLSPLLVFADAAFAGVVERLPDLNLWELGPTVFFGVGAASCLYARGTALHHNPKRQPAGKKNRKGIPPLTMGTVLGAVCLVYCAYLLSQLAYFVGGFSGILPENYTAAEYARRGFFEMAWLCVINLGIMTFGLFLVRRDKGTTPMAVKLLCLFIGAVTLFLVAAASGKMLLYIRSFGLTRLRVLTEVIMLWLGITTVLVTVRLFVSRLPYMKGVVLAALMIGALVSWADVDTQVARYNVTAYQSGRLETVDVPYLAGLGDGAVPWLKALTEDGNPEVAKAARNALARRGESTEGGFREWNYAKNVAAHSE